MRGLSELASVVIAAFIVAVFVVLLPLSIIVGALRRWFWFGLVAGAWARVEQAKDRRLRAGQSTERARDSYAILRDALMETRAKAVTVTGPTSDERC